MQIDARDWLFEVSPDPSAGTPVWTQIGKLNTWSLSNSEGEETVDTTTFESAGHAESQVMQRGKAITLDGRYDRDAAGNRDAGQEACELLAEQVGEASLGGFRFRHKDDTDWTQWDAHASLSDNGGGTNDKTSWGCSFTRSGASTTVAAP